jgi:hypothetical protein
MAFTMPDGSQVSAVDESGRYHVAELLDAALKLRYSRMTPEEAETYKALNATSDHAPEQREWLHQINERFPLSREEVTAQLPRYPKHGRIVGVVPYKQVAAEMMELGALGEVEVAEQMKALMDAGAGRRLGEMMIMTLPAEDSFNASASRTRI